MDGRIFYIFFFKQLRISPGFQWTYTQCCHTPNVRLNREKRHAMGQKNTFFLKKIKSLRIFQNGEKHQKKLCLQTLFLKDAPIELKFGIQHQRTKHNIFLE